MPKEKKCTRRGFLRRAGASGALVLLGAASVPLTGCGRQESGGDADGAPEGAQAGGGSGAAASGAPCSDLSGLKPQQIRWREDNGYVAQTPDPAKRCDNCAYWEPPRGDAPCGGCTVMDGPIAPEGYCDLWEIAEG
jgi:hypothetical protein